MFIEVNFLLENQKILLGPHVEAQIPSEGNGRVKRDQEGKMEGRKEGRLYQPLLLDRDCLPSPLKTCGSALYCGRLDFPKIATTVSPTSHAVLW